MAAAVIAEIKQDIHNKYLGSGDIEAQDSITFCTYFQQQYGLAEGKQSLKEKWCGSRGSCGGQVGFQRCPSRPLSMQTRMITRMITRTSW